MAENVVYEKCYWDDRGSAISIQVTKTNKSNMYCYVKKVLMPVDCTYLLVDISRFDFYSRSAEVSDLISGMQSEREQLEKKRDSDEILRFF